MKKLLMVLCLAFAGLGVYWSVNRSASRSHPSISADETSGPASARSEASHRTATVPTVASGSAAGSTAVSISSTRVSDRRPWDSAFFAGLHDLSAGSAIRFELVGERFAVGRIEHIERAQGEVIYVSGVVSEPEAGRFFFQKQTMPGKAGAFAGVLEFPASKEGYRLEPSGPSGETELVQMSLDKIVCLALPAPDPALVEVEPIPPLDPSDFPDYPIPDYQEGIIPLQSLPGATGVLYIDYQGGYTPTWGGITYERPNVNNSQIRDVWKRVAEDYIPFNVNVTTDLKVYQKAPENSRQRCVVTPTSTAAPGAGGVAYIGSWNWTGDTPCWVFMVSGKACAEAISHEVGHTLQLGHDGQNPSTGYYGGQGNGDVGWAPIMGVGYYKNVSQWSKGEYTSANNTEDDLSIIVNKNNNVDYRTDDTGPLLASSRYLEAYPGNTVFAEGVIETTGDTDAFQFTTSGGTISLRANPVGDWGNLAISATLMNSAGAVLASNNPQTTLWASISTTLASGTYTFRVTGAGRNDPVTTGFSAYASLGYYTVTGTVANVRLSDRFTLPENAPYGTRVGVVAPRNINNDALTYTISSGNTSGAFAIDNAGRLTVINPSVLNYETLARNTQLPVQFELFVNITDVTNPSLTELKRRVVVTIQDVNEVPTMSGLNLTVLEHTQPGTLIGTLTASDPDFYNLLAYKIVGGNSNGMFSVGSQSGELTVAGDLSRAARTSYQLQIRVSDQAGPQPLMATSVVNVAVMPNLSPFRPGTIKYAIYGGIGGNLVSGLTSAAKFPADPDSEISVTSFEGQTDRGDEYGSVIRGYVIPPVSGSYTFWISSDDNSELWMSTSTNPAAMTKIAEVSGDGNWTDPRQWTKFSSQRSAARTLSAGQAYYIEARQKEGSGGDNLAVAWAGPTISGPTVISGLYLAPYEMNFQPHATGFAAQLRRDAYPGTRVGRITIKDVNVNDAYTYTIVSGNDEGIFTVDSDGYVLLADAAALQASGTAGFSLAVNVVDRGSLSTSAAATVTIVEAASLPLTLQREMFYNIGGGTAISDLTGNAKYPSRPDALVPMTDFATPADVADNYGSRIRAYVTPPFSGSYRFFIASDDASQLKMSSNDSPLGAAVIAAVSGYTGTNEWTKEAGQASAYRSLVAGQRYYIEALQKEGGGGDHVAVAWAGPGISGTSVITSDYLAPADINSAPQFGNQSFGVFPGATNGTLIGRLTAQDSPMDTLTFRLLDGNTNNTFALDPASGALSVADNTLIASGAVTSFSLKVAVQDSGYGGRYPLKATQAIVTVNVFGAGAALVWTGGADGNGWADRGNWAGAVPSAGARLVFGYPFHQANLNDIVSSVGLVQMTNGGFSVSGKAVALQSGLSNSGDNTWAIDTTLTAGQTWNNLGGTLTVSGAVDNGGNALSLVAAGPVRLSGTVSGAGGLTKSGAAALLMSGAHPYAGTTVINSAGGTATALEVNGLDDLELPASDLLLNGRMDLWNHNATIGALLGGGAIFANDSSHRLTIGVNGRSAAFSGVIQNSSWASGVTLGVVKDGAGTQTLTGANTFSGGLQVRNGQILAGNASAFGTGTVTLGDTATGTNAVAALASAAVTITNSLVVSGNGIGPATLGTANMNPGAANMQFGGPLTLYRDVTLQAGSTDRTTFAGRITGVGDLVIQSPFSAWRRVVLDRTSGLANDFEGDVRIGTNAVLQVGVSDSIGNRTIPDSAVVFLAPGAQLRLSPIVAGDSETVAALVSQADNSGLVDVITGSAFTLGFGSTNGFFGGQIVNSSGSLSLTKSGAGRQVLAGTNTFSGLVTVSGGVLVAASDAALGASNPGTVVNLGATLAVSNSVNLGAEPLVLAGDGFGGAGALCSESGSNSVSGPITLQSSASIHAQEGRLMLSNACYAASTDLTLDSESLAVIEASGPISGWGRMIKTGPGSLMLNSTNPFTGTVRVVEGSLVIGSGGSVATAVVVELAAGTLFDVTAPVVWLVPETQTLKGSGTVKGAALVRGTVAPGFSIGVLTFNDNVSLEGQTVIEIAKTSSATANDLIACASTLTLGGALTVTNIGPEALAAGDSFRLFQAATIGGNFGTLQLPSLSPGLAWDTSRLAAQGVLTVAVAEPATPPALLVSSSGAGITLSWPVDYTGYVLQAQTNQPGQGLGSGWYPVPDVTNNTFTVELDPAAGSIFYRLIKQ